MSLWPIFIPSKGRAATGGVFPLLAGEGIRATIVVEPHEVAEYRVMQPLHTILALPQSGQGIVYSRSFILNHAKAQGHEWFWMMDDDIRSFHKVVNKRTPKCSAAGALLGAQAFADADQKIGQVALEYAQLAWSAAKPTRRNSYCDVVVGIRTALAPGVMYRPRAAGKEDRDFTLQTLAAGWDTVRACHLAFAAPSIGSNAGGLHAEYAAGKERAWAATLAELWPHCVTVQTKPSGRIDAKIDWAKVRAKAPAL